MFSMTNARAVTRDQAAACGSFAAGATSVRSSAVPQSNVVLFSPNRMVSTFFLERHLRRVKVASQTWEVLNVQQRVQRTLRRGLDADGNLFVANIGDSSISQF
jgi:hypothetical protein